MTEKVFDVEDSLEECWHCHEKIARMCNNIEDHLHYQNCIKCGILCPTCRVPGVKHVRHDSSKNEIVIYQCTVCHDLIEIQEERTGDRKF